MQPMIRQYEVDTDRYAKCVATSKRVRFDIDRDVIRGRSFDFTTRFLPDGLSKVDRLDFLTSDEQRLLSQVQGRTYANIFGLVERYINVKMLDRSRDHWFGDQVALEALVRFSDEELKHQELFRRVEALAGRDPSAVRQALLAVHGIGRETADSIALYAAGLPLFVIDAYTRRVFSRLGLVEGGEPYDTLQRRFMDALPRDAALFNDYHAQIVNHAKDVCRKRPLCDRCPLTSVCPRVGVIP